MSNFTDMLANDAQYMANPDEFGEQITYTPKGQSTLTGIYAVIERLEPEQMAEGPGRRKKIILHIPNKATVGLTSKPKRGDSLTASWEAGDDPVTMRVSDNLTRDEGGTPGMWIIVAESSIG